MKRKILLLFMTMNTCLLSHGQMMPLEEHLPIDPENSNIHWIGEYLFYFGGHDGNIKFKEGYFIKSNEVISGGTFVIDMNSMTNLDIDTEDGRTSLIDHLKDPDFFDVQNHPTAQLVIKSVQYHDDTHLKIYADLTIKGVTNPIDFQATVDYENETMEAKFKIDRILWGVSYNSKLRDGAISDAIGFEVVLSL